MKRFFLLLSLSLLLCIPYFAQATDATSYPSWEEYKAHRASQTTEPYYTWEQYMAHRSGQAVKPTEAQLNVKCSTYLSDVTNALNLLTLSSLQYPRTAPQYPSAIWDWFLTHYKLVLLFSLILVLFFHLPTWNIKRKIRRLEREERRRLDAERKEFKIAEHQRLREIHDRLSKSPFELAQIPLEPDEQIVYITWSGLKYHKEECGVVKAFTNTKFKVNLSVALYHGFTPCSRCCADMPEPEIERISSYIR